MVAQRSGAGCVDYRRSACVTNGCVVVGVVSYLQTKNMRSTLRSLLAHVSVQ